MKLWTCSSPKNGSSVRRRCFSKFCRFTFLATFGLLFPFLLYGNTDYYRHVYFDNSLTSDSYFYSGGQPESPSSLERLNGRLPVETKTFLTPPNALRLEWQSQPGGNWEAEVRVVDVRNRFPEFTGDNLYFWCFSAHAISAADLPRIVLSNTREGL